MAGVIMLLTLLKPLFARSAEPHAVYTLNREKEPELFAFLFQICAAVGAPPPERVELDCALNASARLSRLFHHEGPRLRLGLPLVAGLD